MELLISARDKYQKEHPEKELLTAAAAVGPLWGISCRRLGIQGDYRVDSGALKAFIEKEWNCLRMPEPIFSPVRPFHAFGRLR